MNICEHLTFSARLFPERDAIVFEGHRLTYSELDQMAAGAAEVLRDRGVQRGDRVCILLANVPAFAVWYYGALRLGAVVVSISTRLAPPEVTFIIDDCQAVLLVADDVGMETLRDMLPDCVAHALPVCELGDLCNGGSLIENRPHELPRWAQTRPAEPAVILYTSGTTGFAKGATLSHQNVRATVHAFNHLCEMRDDDRILLSVPLFHCYGQNALLNSGLNVGATMILQRRFDLNESRQLIVDERVTRLFGVPTTFQLLCECCDPSDLQSVVYCFSAAATLPIQLSRRWQEKFGMPIFEGYGLTETAPFASYNHRLKFVPGSIGTPVDLVEMKIVDTDTGQILPPGEPGEIAIRGPNVMLGYWNRPQDTADAIRDGWFHSGDIGQMDDDGYFYIVDRLKDMISIGGMKVFPAEVERILLDHPVVSESAVVGFPDKVFGEQVVAFIVRSEPVTDASFAENDRELLEQIRFHCEENLADYKRPKQILFVDELPRNPAGKILKTRLREMELPATSDSSVGSVAGLTNDAANQEDSGSRASPSSTDIPVGVWIDRLHNIHPASRERAITEMIQEEVGILTGAEQTPAADARFVESGLDSLAIVELRDRLQSYIGPQLDLSPTLVFDYPRVCDLASFLTESLSFEAERTAKNLHDSSLHVSPPRSTTKESANPADTDPLLHSHASLRSRIESMSEDTALEELLREINE